MDKKINFNEQLLNAKGFNLIAILNLCDLNAELKNTIKRLLPDSQQFNQVILLANAGKALWEAIKVHGLKGEHPIDSYTIKTIEKLFSNYYPEIAYQIYYPLHESCGSSQSQKKTSGNKTLNLQKLGECVGWHHPSPFRVGINQHWGSWFAYRAVLLCHSQFETTMLDRTTSPCQKCETKICLSYCPANAVSEDHFDLEACIHYRIQKQSRCEKNCLARYHCPVAQKHRYSDEQIEYHYQVSLAMLKPNLTTTS